jgi:hypothetical protein
VNSASENTELTQFKDRDSAVLTSSPAREMTTTKEKMENTTGEATEKVRGMIR